MPTHPQIVNESTSVIQVYTKGLTAADSNAVVYVSSSATPGLFVTVRDADGFLSSPNAIRLSTVGGAAFSDGSTTAVAQQRFSYFSLYADSTTRWTLVNASPFADSAASYTQKGVDALAVTTSSLSVADLLSSMTVRCRNVTVGELQVGGAYMLASSLVVNSFPDFVTTAPGTSRAIVGGAVKVYGSTATVGSLFSRSTVTTGGDFFAGGQNVSSKNGIISIGGNITTLSSLRAQGVNGGNLLVALGAVPSSVLVRGPTRLGGPLATLASTATVAGPVTASTLAAGSVIAGSSLEWGVQGAQGMVLTAGASQFAISGPLALANPSTATAQVASLDTIQTGDFILQDQLEYCPCLSSFTLSSAAILNPLGSASISSILGQSLTTTRTNADTVAAATFAASDTASLGPGWTISTFPAAAAPPPPFLADTFALETSSLLVSGATSIRASANNRGAATAASTTTSTATATSALTISGVRAQFYTTLLDLSGSAIYGPSSVTTGTATWSTLATQTISSPSTIVSAPPFQLSAAAAVSTLATRTATISSFTVTTGRIGTSAAYSTLNPSTPWFITTASSLSTPPFQTTDGLGTAFDPVRFQVFAPARATYTMVDPIAAAAAAANSRLSTPYVNTVLTLSGITTVPGQPASDSVNALSFPSYTPFEGWRVKRLDLSGTLSTVAGRYRYFYGDNELATTAAIGAPVGLGLLGSNEPLIADASNSRIRMIHTTLRMSTIVPPELGLSTPLAVVKDLSGSLYIADPAAAAIKKYQGGFLMTVVGAANLSTPAALAIDSSNNLFIADATAHVVRRLAAATSTVTTVAGTLNTPGYTGDGAAATAATLSGPRGIALDPENNLYIADTGNNVLRKVTAATGVITTYAGTGTPAFSGNGGPAASATLFGPRGLTTNRGASTLYVADTLNNCVRQINRQTDVITQTAGTTTPGFSGDIGLAVLAELNSPTGVVVDVSGAKLYIADEANYRIRYVDLLTNRIRTLGGNGSPYTPGDGGAAANAMFIRLNAVARDPSDNLIVVDTQAQVLRKYVALTGTIEAFAGQQGAAGYSGDGGPATAATLYNPNTAVSDTSGNIYFTDELNQRVRKVAAATGTITTVAGTGPAGYSGDGGPATAATLNYPRALTIDQATNDLYIGDTSNYCIRKVTAATGVITTFAGLGYQDPVQAGVPPINTPLQTVTALAIDPSGQLAFTEAETNRAWRVASATTGLVTPLTATSTVSYLGDAAPLSNAIFNDIRGMIVDTCGNFVFADNGNRRLRRTYTRGRPNLPRYLNLSMSFSNLSTLTGDVAVGVNGNQVASFSASTQTNGSYSVSDLDIFSLPLQSSNPVFGNQEPFVTLTQSSGTGLTYLTGRMWLNQVPAQQQLTAPLDSNAGIQMNFGTLEFPNSLQGITIQNRANDASMRSVFYFGSLVNASDPAVKEVARDPADHATAAAAAAAIPLRRYAYIAPYRSTFNVKDQTRLGVLTSEVAPHIPSAVHPSPLQSSLSVLDAGQLRFAHLALTQELLAATSTLTAAVADLQRLKERRVFDRSGV